MIKTRPAEYEVAGQHNNHLWLEVRDGPDAGIRVSVPRDSDAYTDRLQQKVDALAEGEVHEFVLISKDEESPNWLIAQIDPDTDTAETDSDPEPVAAAE